MDFVEHAQRRAEYYQKLKNINISEEAREIDNQIDLQNLSHRLKELEYDATKSEELQNQLDHLEGKVSRQARYIQDLEKRLDKLEHPNELSSFPPSGQIT